MAGHATLSCDEFLDLAAGVALDAADAEDVRRVEEHAAACAKCRAELDRFRGTAAALAVLVPQRDPATELRTRLFETVRQEPKTLANVSRLWPRLNLRRPRPSAAWLVAAASFIVAIASLVWVALLQAQITELRNNAEIASQRSSRFERVVTVLASTQLNVMPLQPAVASPTSSGYVFLDPSSGSGMLMCHHLPPVTDGHAYQIWFVRGNDRVSAGMLWPDHSGDGYTMIQVPSDLQTFDSIGLTEEPSSGSAWPTTPRVIGTPLKS